MFYAIAAVVAFLIASYTDIKRREVPDSLTIGLIVTGLALHALESFLTSNPSPIISSAYMAILAFAFSYLLYKIGAWAGGDVKLFTGLGAMLPSYGALDYFPFLVFAASFLATLPFVIVYISYFFITVKALRKEITPVLKRDLKKSAASAIPISLALALLAGLTAQSLLASVFYAYIISFTTIFGLHSFRIAKEKILRKIMPISQLEEGMIPAENIYMGKIKVADSRLARGLTIAEIRKLKKLKKTLTIKLSIPFVPIITLGLIILFFLEKVIK